ncbi:MAG: UDP-N-acetylmuramoyl-L-alanyl-D-glutamate--2,6-diaminopimelate ligase [Bacillota bacterium]|mgnify:FL=1|jgi:UDP-N-acetylmuramoyl-L-alanyl-D-glutamate--2,6-diaminopimelate ligase|nr:UDP-N-acetylmuramoyl-L-alanyl-D-glutamate--2,6-diaminopimelate ligase [Bacillota bacterium]
MRLSELIDCLKIVQVIGSSDIPVTGFSMDSRRIEPGNMFVALTEPELADRREFIPHAVSAGATSVLVEEPLRESGKLPGVTQVVVPDAQVASALMAARFYGEPARKLTVVGVTGTKGKTTTSHLIAEMLESSGTPTGLIGTVSIRYPGVLEQSPNTTPHAIELQKILAQMVESGVKAVSMEVSSHALRLHRVSGIKFSVGVFTNLGGDHMNFHGTMEDYVQAKSMLMAAVSDGSTVVNIDDERGALMRASSLCECYTYGLSKDAVIRATDVKTSLAGSEFTLHCPAGSRRVKMSLPGRFNVYNALAAAGAALSFGVPLDAIVDVLEQTRGVPGRMESVDTADLGFRVVVDYAHTAESMENVLQTLRDLNPQRLITVFGCGGDRDKTRRPKMGKVAAAYSDLVFITSDNPRTEDPASIIRDIVSGLVEDGVDQSRYTVIEDRAEAIERAVREARSGDIVAILGKGHEDYQIIGYEKIHFDDREVAGKVVRALVGG